MAPGPAKGYIISCSWRCEVHPPNEEKPSATTCPTGCPTGTSPIIDNKKPCIKKFNLGDTVRPPWEKKKRDPLGIPGQGEEIDADHHGNQRPWPSTTWRAARTDEIWWKFEVKFTVYPKSDQGILGSRWSRESSAWPWLWLKTLCDWNRQLWIPTPPGCPNRQSTILDRSRMVQICPDGTVHGHPASSNLGHGHSSTIHLGWRELEGEPEIFRKL